MAPVSDTPWQDYLWRARFSEERPSMAEVLRAALSGETEQVGAPMVVSGSRVTPEVFDEAMKVTDAEFHDGPCKGYIVMSPRSYYDVRKFGRDVLDIETCAPRPLTGATLWGYPILTTKDAEPGVAWLVGRRRDGTWGRMKMVLNAQEYGSWNPINKVLNEGAAVYWSWHDDGDEIVAQVMCGTLYEWLATLVALEGPYVRCDDPRKRLLGMRKVEGGTRIMIPLVRVIDRTSWGIGLPSTFVEMLKTPEGREKLAWVLSVGDHCLDFG